MVEFIQVITTTAHKKDSEEIAETLVQRKLAACVQVIGPISSTYRWKDKVEKAEEWLCLIKTQKRFFNKLKEAIKKIHPYETPEIVAMPVVAGSEDYLEWLRSTLKK